eukprot:9476077-Heterocapsa_arctica.AAC.1
MPSSDSGQSPCVAHTHPAPGGGAHGQLGAAAHTSEDTCPESVTSATKDGDISACIPADAAG